MKKIFSAFICLAALLTWTGKANAQCDDGNYDCYIVIELADSYGDGWNNNTLSISQAGVELGSYTIEDGSELTDTLRICTGNGQLSVTYNYTGQYAYENSFTLTDSLGTVIASCPTYSAESFGTQLIAPCPSCPAPDYLTLDDVTSTGATISWTELGSATAWQYTLDIYSDEWTDISSTTLTLDELESNTTYTLYVRSICSDDDISLPASITFKTPCGLVAVPYFESFEDYATYADPECWNNLENGSGYYYNYPYVYNYGTPHTGSQCLYFYTSSSYTDESIRLPQLDIANNQIELSFYAYISSANVTLQVGYIPAASENPADFVLVGSYTSVNGQTSVHRKLAFTFDTVTYEGAMRVVIRVKQASSYASIYIDDVSVDYLPPCGYPSNFAVVDSVQASHSVVLSWDGTMPAYQIAYAESGTLFADIDPETYFDVTGENTFTVTDLDNSKNYDFYLRSVCDEGYGKWLDPITNVRPYVYTNNKVTDTIQWCDGTIVDDGGLTGKHSRIKRILTLMPDNDDNIIHLTGTINLYQYEDYYGEYYPSYFYIYDGADTTGTPALTIDADGNSTVDFYAHGPLTIFFDPSAANPSMYYHGQGYDLHASCETPSFCDQMKSVSATAISFDSIRVDWEAMATPEVGYTITVTDLLDEEAEPVSVNINDPATTSYMLTGLLGRHSYKIEVNTVCTEGPGYAMSTSATTPCDVNGNAFVGDAGSTTTSAYAPFYGYYKYSLYQMLINKDSIDDVLDTLFGFSYTSNTANTSQYTIEVYMDTTSLTTLGDANANKYQVQKAANKVYSGKIVPTTGKNQITFDRPWITPDASKNVLLTVVNKTGSWYSSMYARTTNTTNTMSLYSYSDNTIYDATNPPTTGYSASYILNVNFDVPCGRVVCATPEVSLASLTPNSASVNWSATGAEESWDVDYMAETDATWTNALTGTTLTSATITGLTEATNYYVRVTAHCGDKDKVATINFKTPCNAATLPLVQSFKHFFASSYGDDIEPCWDRYCTSTYSSYPYTTTDYNHNYDTTLYMYGYYNSTLILPFVDAPTDSLVLMFTAHMGYSGYAGLYEVGICTDFTNPNSYYVKDTIVVTQTDETAFYCFLDTNFTGDGSGRVFIRAIDPNYSYASQYMDSLVLDRLPACREVSKVTFVSASESEFVFNVYDKMNRTSYEVAYSTSDLASASSATVTKDANNNITLTGLSDASLYNIWIAGVCEDGSRGFQTFVGRFQTLCAPIAVTDDVKYTNELSEDVDFVCLDAISSESGKAYWTNVESVSYPPSGMIYVGGDALMFTYTGSKDTVASTARLLLPVFDFSQLSTPADLSFYYRSFYNGYTTYTDIVPEPVVKLYYRTSASAEWTYFAEFTKTNGMNWDRMLISLPASQGASHYEVSMVGEAYCASAYACVDYIEVSKYNTCRPPLNVNVFDITDHDAKASWTSNNFAKHRVQYRSVGSWVWSTYTVEGDSAAVVPLASATQYELRVANVCEGNASSDYSPIVLFTTPMCLDNSTVSSFDTTDETAVSALPVNTYYSYSEYILSPAELGSDTVTFESFRMKLNDKNYDGYMYITLYLDTTGTTQYPDSGAIFIRGTHSPMQMNLATYAYIEDLNLNENNEFEVKLPGGGLEYDGHSSVIVFMQYYYYEYDYDEWGNSIYLYDTLNWAAHKVSTNRALTLHGDYYIYNSDVNQSAYDTMRVASNVVADIQLIRCNPQCWTPTVRRTSSTASSITVDWVYEAGYTQISYKKTTDADFTTPVTVYAGHTYTIEGLEPLTEYVVRLSRDCSAMGLASSEWVDVHVTTAMECSFASNVKATSVSAHTATLDWEAGTNANKWEVHVWNDGFNEYYEFNTHPVTITGLTPGSSYQVQVRAFCGDMNELYGNWSETTTFQNTCAPVTGLNATVDKDAKTVTATWAAGKYNTKWFVSWGSKDFDPNQAVGYKEVTEPSITLDQLKGGATYTIRVRAICESDWNSDWSSTNVNTNWVGIDDVDAEGVNFTLQPNPATTRVVLSLEGFEGVATVSLMSVDGREVQQFTTAETSTTIDLSQLATGTYFVRVQTEGWTSVRKLIVK